eukprot:g18063.t1
MLRAAIAEITSWLDAVDVMTNAQETMADFEIVAASKDDEENESEVRNKRGAHLRSAAPSKAATQKAWKRNAAAAGIQKLDARVAPIEDIQNTVVELLTKRCAVFDYDLDTSLALPDAEADGQGVIVLVNPKQKAYEKLVNVKKEFGSGADWDRFAALDGYKERHQYLEWLMGCTATTCTKKVALLQRFLAVENAMTQKTRFRMLTEEEQLTLPADDDEVVRVWHGPFNGEALGEDGAKRRKLLQLKNNRSREEQKQEAEAEEAMTARITTAYRVAASRAEARAVRYYKLLSALKLETLLNIDICQRGRWFLDVNADTSIVEWQRCNPDGVRSTDVLASAAKKITRRPFVVVRLGPDATNMFKTKQLAAECVVITANDDYTISLVPLTPVSVEHEGGAQSLLQDIYNMLADAIPMPGAILAEWISDPLALFLIASDCGSDCLLFVREFRKLCTAARLERFRKLGLQSNAQNAAGVGAQGAFFDDFDDDDDDGMQVDDDDNTAVNMASVPLEIYCMQMLCMNHQYHLMDGELIDGLLDVFPDFLKFVRDVVKAYDMWGSKQKGCSVRKFAKHRWQTLKDTLTDLLKNKAVATEDVNAIDVKKREEGENRATAVGAKKAMAHPEFWSYARSLRRVLEVTDACARSAKQDASEVFSDTKLEEMKRHRAHRLHDLNAICQAYLEVQGDGCAVGLSLILHLIMRLPDREKQYWTWPMLFQRFFSPYITERRRAAESLLLTAPESRDPFLRLICENFHDELDAVAGQDENFTMPLRLWKYVAPIFIGCSGTAVVVEGMHSDLNNHRKVAPNLRHKKAGELTVIGREKPVPWEDWQALGLEWKDRYDRRTRLGKEASATRDALDAAIERQLGLVRKDKNRDAADAGAPAAAGGGVEIVEVVRDGEEEGDDDDLLHKVLERVLHMKNKNFEHPQLQHEPPSIGGPVENLGVMNVPYVSRSEHWCPEICKRFSGERTAMAEEGYCDLMCLVQKKLPAPKGRRGGNDAAAPADAAQNALVQPAPEADVEPIYCCYYKALSKGYLLKATKIALTEQNLGRPLPHDWNSLEAYLLKFREPRTISHWATRPPETAKGKMLSHRKNDMTRLLWCKRHDCLMCVADTTYWKDEQAPRKDILHPRKKKEYEDDVAGRDGGQQGGKVMREYMWKQLDMAVAVPELVLSEKLLDLYSKKKIYVIFRPEEAKWWVKLEKKSRRKSPKMADGNTTDLGVPTKEELTNFMGKVGKGKVAKHADLLDLVEVRSLDPTAGGEQRVTDSVTELMGQHPKNKLRLRSNMIGVYDSMVAGTFSNPHPLVTIRDTGKLLLLSGSHRVQALKMYKQTNGNACKDLRLTCVVVSEVLNEVPALISRYVRTKNEGQQGLRTTMAEKFFDTFPELEEEFKQFTCEPGNKNANKHNYFKTRCDSTGPAYEISEFAWGLAAYGATSRINVFRQLRLEHLSAVCRDLLKCAFFQLFCGQSRKDSDDMPKGLGPALYDNIPLCKALLELIKVGHHNDEEAATEYHRNLVHVCAETCRN